MADSHADINKHVKLYIGVFAVLFVLTIVTVLASRVQLSGAGNVVLALAIAVCKASLVAAVFMHLKWEKTGWIWWPLALCAFFLVMLMALPGLTVGEANARAPHYSSWDSLPTHEAGAEGAGNSDAEH